ncbi:MAG: class II fumarate hydratase [Proteobacteria bacterium]|nr:class II fumarate hydratase [Pseudomonadota bacterium]
MPSPKTRIERDSMGELAVPAEARWGAQTQRAVENFRLGGGAMPREFIAALGLIKQAAAFANQSLGLLPPPLAIAIAAAAAEVAAGQHDQQFPVDIFQTGSGTSSNMNANEVVANLAAERLGSPVHPNDHVNLGQSSNDVVPTAIHVSVLLLWQRELQPALQVLVASLARREAELASVTKTGRTHLMDAMPLTFGQEVSAWRAQVVLAEARLSDAAARLAQLAQGGTAVGTGINCHVEFPLRFCAELSRLTSVRFGPASNYFAALSSQATALEWSAQLRGLAVELLKICNDLRWMNSGPLAGLAEIALPALQQGSSIMPGKVNPVIPEAVAMAAAQIIGWDSAVTIAAQSGNFQLNVMLPLIANNLICATRLSAAGVRSLAVQAIDGFNVRGAEVAARLARNPVLATALNPLVGYDQAARIAKRAFAEGRTVLEIAIEETDLGRDVLQRALDPSRLTQSGRDGSDQPQ